MSRFLGFAFTFSLALAGCTDSSPAEKTVTLSASTLPALGSGYVYEGWLIDADGPHSTGRFTVDGTGMPSVKTSMIDAALADSATAAAITIEPATGDDPAPSPVHLLGGALLANNADLAISYAGAIGTDFGTATGTYILATPTTAADTADNNQGIWWLVPPTTAGGTPTPGLTLPTLPAGWKYEGWVADAAGPVSTGKFTSVTGADSDSGGPAASTDAAPPFPGQDFINPARVLTTGMKTAITVEPDPDDAPTPFGIKPLFADPIGAQTAPTSLPMQQNETFPTVHLAVN